MQAWCGVLAIFILNQSLFWFVTLGLWSYIVEVLKTSPSVLIIAAIFWLNECLVLFVRIESACVQFGTVVSFLFYCSSHFRQYTYWEVPLSIPTLKVRNIPTKSVFPSISKWSRYSVKMLSLFRHDDYSLFSSTVYTSYISVIFVLFLPLCVCVRLLCVCSSRSSIIYFLWESISVWIFHEGKTNQRELCREREEGRRIEKERKKERRKEAGTLRILVEK